MAHNRKIVLGGASLTMARVNRHTMDVTGEIMNELEHLMISTNYLDNAPFKWVGLILRFGLKNEDIPHYQRITKKYGDLPVAIELDTHELQHASRGELKELYMIATLKTLVDVGKKYNLPYEKFEEMLAELTTKRASSAS
jgi:hypothetical protein